MRTFSPSDNNDQDLLMQWIDQAPGAFSVYDLEISRLKFDDRFMLIENLEVLTRVGYLERFGPKRGWYIKAVSELVELDFINAMSEAIDIWLPFDLSESVEIHAGNVIIIAGTPNSGKSALIYNTIKENRHKGWDQYLFNSESGAGELRKRLDKFDDISIDQWGFKAYQRSENFHQVVKKGDNVINYIDFLEVHDDFFKIGGYIKQIHDALDGAIAIIGLQKNPGSETGLGGYRMLEVTRLAIALEFQKVKVIKAKNFRNPANNPNGMHKKFTLHDGYKIRCDDTWHEEVK